MLPLGENGEPFNPGSKKDERKKKKKTFWNRWESQVVVATTSVVLLQHVGTIGWWGVQPWPALFVWLVGCLLDCAIPTFCLRLSET